MDSKTVPAPTTSELLQRIQKLEEQVRELTQATRALNTRTFGLIQIGSK